MFDHHHHHNLNKKSIHENENVLQYLRRICKNFFLKIGLAVANTSRINELECFFFENFHRRKTFISNLKRWEREFRDFSVEGTSHHFKKKITN